MHLILRSAPLILLVGVAAAQNAVLQWNDVALAVIRVANTSPPAASRHLAMLHAAIFDAANGVRPEYTHYLTPANAHHNANRVAAVAVAGHDVMVALQPAHTAAFDALRDGLLASVPDTPGKTNGIAWGALVAQQLLAARSNDGSTAVATYPGSTAPGAWRPTISFGGVVRPALLPAWGNVTPFGIASVASLQPPPPPALATPLYALEVNVTKDLGGTVSTTRTAEQTEIALFWGYGPGTATPPGHWNQIARAVAVARKLDLVESARMFALLNVAMADAAIVCWRCKYDIGLWRPITAIQLDGDGNAETTADPAWTPLLPTPPFPEYTSGHSTFSAAAATVLEAFFGTDSIPFEVGSDDLPGIVRSYPGFGAAALESGWSRIYGGIHFPSGNLEGLQCGTHIGFEVASTLMQRLHGHGPR
jgi:hypothetical protein